jgi:hypothetical protein
VLFEKASRRKSESATETSKIRPPVTVEDVLEAVGVVCSVERGELRAVRRGRRGNLARKLAAYGLVIHAGLKAVDAASILALHPVRVSQCIADLRKKRKENQGVGDLMAEIAKKLNR